MNEELESTNNELQTINNELQVSTGDFDTFREVSQSVFTDRGLAVIALDPEFRVRTWNSVAEELWGMKATETVGEPFFGMDFGLPVNTLVEPVRDCLNKGAGFHGREVTGVNRRGRPIQFRVTGVPFGADDRPSGVALLVEKEGAAD